MRCGWVSAAASRSPLRSPAQGQPPSPPSAQTRRRRGAAQEEGRVRPRVVSPVLMVSGELGVSWVSWGVLGYFGTRDTWSACNVRAGRALTEDFQYTG
eukprot:6208715-Pleurochrysis_carterae.AAC.3